MNSMNSFIIEPDLKPNLFFLDYFGINEVALKESFQSIRNGLQCVSINKEKDINNSNFKDLNNYLLTGIDIPVLLNYTNKIGRKKVFIIGSEPLRNWTFFKSNSLHTYNDIALNTPFSIHQNDGLNTLYGKIITKFLETHDVYLTDVRKMWFAGFNYHSDFLNNPIHKEYLKEELSSYSDIEHIITFGKDSFSYIKGILNDDPRVQYFIHPSKRTIGNQRKVFFAQRNINDEKYTSQEAPYIKLISEITAKTTPNSDLNVGLTNH